MSEPHAGLHGSMEGRQVDILKLRIGDVGSIVVAAAFGCAIAGKMLGAGQHVVRRADGRPLEATYLRAAMAAPR